jgi:hypothetical protein
MARMLGMSEERIIDRLRRDPPTWKHADCGETQPYPAPPDFDTFIRGL